MQLLSDIITYVRRLIKSPSNNQISDGLIIDYVNRFWINDVDARIQLFDLKTKYQFMTVPGYDQYNMPLYALQHEDPSNTNQEISYYPVYQGTIDPVYINGIQVPYETNKTSFFNIYPQITQQMMVVGVGNGTSGPYNFTFPIAPNNSVPLNPPFQYILRGHVDMNGIIQFANAGFNFMDPPMVSNSDATGSPSSITSIPSQNVFPAVFITSNGVDGSNIVVSDSGQFLSNSKNLGLLMQTNKNNFPNGNLPLSNGYELSFPITGATNANPTVLTATTSFSVGQIVLITGVTGMTELNGNSYTVTANGGTTLTIDVDSTGFGTYDSGGLVSSVSNVINYFTGEVQNLFFPDDIPEGVDINAVCYLFQSGLPRGLLNYNNTLTIRPPPDQAYLVEVDAYLSPAAYLNSSQSIQFSYMCEYIARGAARKILSDTGDIEQFQFYEPFFQEQEQLVWKRSQRQFTSTRTQTIYSQGINMGQQGSNSLGGYN